MVKVQVLRNPRGQITTFTVEGHAGYGPKGTDIVCAAVSALTFGTVNAIVELLNVPLDVELKEEGGFLRCKVPAHLERTVQEKVDLLLEAMFLSLRSIEQEYRQHVRLVVQESKGD